MGDFPTVIATVGGEGTRLFPLTLKQPKPLLSMCGEAVLSRTFETLAAQGCRNFILASKGLENTTRFKDYFKEGKGFSMRLRLRPEAKFMYQPNYSDRGNADALRFCMEYFDINSDVLVVSGDNVIDIELENLIKYHREKHSILTVVLKELKESEDVSQFGVAELDKDMKIKRFVEKPGKEGAPSRLTNTSIYLFSPKIREVFAEMGERVMDIGKDVIPYLTEKGFPVYGYICEGYWADVGTPENFLKTTMDILHGKIRRIRFDSGQMTLSKILGMTPVIEEGRWIHPSTLKRGKEHIKEINIGKYVNIGAECKLGKGVNIESSYIGDNCVIGDNTTIRNSIIMDFTNIGKDVRLNKCIVGRYSTIEDQSIIDCEMAVEVIMGNPDLTPVVGEGVTILKGSVIGPKKRVAPIQESHKILSTRRFIELGYDKNNIYFIEG